MGGDFRPSSMPKFVVEEVARPSLGPSVLGALLAERKPLPAPQPRHTHCSSF